MNRMLELLGRLDNTPASVSMLDYSNRFYRQCREGTIGDFMLFDKQGVSLGSISGVFLSRVKKEKWLYDVTFADFRSGQNFIVKNCHNRRTKAMPMIKLSSRDILFRDYYSIKTDTFTGISFDEVISAFAKNQR